MRTKAGAQMAKSFDAQKFLKRVGLGKEDYHFWKQVGKALLCIHAVWCGIRLWNETSPLGDEKAMEEFVAKGGMIGTTIGPKGIIESDKDSYNYQKALQDKKVEQKPIKLWTRMK
ncbi:hypothetical protein HAX54_017049 [Datura stramonium]|uniref:Uncharacterized protein n=1 Tax=Datura stramonium TaxID=4076 RepID=A0ABS8UKN4_DATST|nr:hypothetical protein [Datura stramonium]